MFGCSYVVAGQDRNLRPSGHVPAHDRDSDGRVVTECAAQKSFDQDRTGATGKIPVRSGSCQPVWITGGRNVVEFRSRTLSLLKYSYNRSNAASSSPKVNCSSTSKGSLSRWARSVHEHHLGVRVGRRVRPDHVQSVGPLRSPIASLICDHISALCEARCTAFPM